ncbi:hypothetical protein D3C75_474540 [compost metagenome]
MVAVSWNRHISVRFDISGEAVRHRRSGFNFHLDRDDSAVSVITDDDKSLPAAMGRGLMDRNQNPLLGLQRPFRI